MLRRAHWAIAVISLLGFCVATRAQESYYGNYVIHLKPGKGAAFEALVKKMVAANRDYQGDNWVVIQTAFGESGTISSVALRQSYGEFQKASDAFDKAVEKAMGHPGTEQFFEELDNCIAAYHPLLLRRRPDLSSNFPSDRATEAKIVGNTRWIRTIRITVRVGQYQRFEELAKHVKAAQEKADPNLYSWVSESVAGESEGVYYVSQLRSSLAGFDGETPLPQIMGNDAWQSLLKTASEVIQSEDVTLSQIRGDLSNPPDDIASVAPSFWRPKPAAAAATPGAGAAKAKVPPKK